MRLVRFGDTVLPVRMQDVRISDTYPAAYMAGPGGAYVDAYGQQAPATGGTAECSGLYADEVPLGLPLLDDAWYEDFGADGVWNLARTQRRWIDDPGWVRVGARALSGTDAQTAPALPRGTYGTVPPGAVVSMTAYVRGAVNVSFGGRAFKSDGSGNRLSLHETHVDSVRRWTQVRQDVALAADEDWLLPLYRMRTPRTYNAGICAPAIYLPQIAVASYPGWLEAALWTGSTAGGGDGAWARGGNAWTYTGGTTGTWTLSSPRWDDDGAVSVFTGASYALGAYVSGNAAGLQLTVTWRSASGASLGTVQSVTEAAAAADVARGVLHAVSGAVPANAAYVELDFARASSGANEAVTIARPFVMEWEAGAAAGVGAAAAAAALQARRGQADWLWAETDDGRLLRRRAQLHDAPADQGMQQAGAGLYPASAVFSLGGVGWERTGQVSVAGTADGAAKPIVNDGPASPHCTLALALTSSDDGGDTAEVEIAYGDIHLHLEGLAIDAGLAIEIDGLAGTVYQTLAGERTAAYAQLRYGANHRAPRILEAAAGTQEMTVTGTRCAGAWTFRYYGLEVSA